MFICGALKNNVKMWLRYIYIYLHTVDMYMKLSTFYTKNLLLSEVFPTIQKLFPAFFFGNLGAEEALDHPWLDQGPAFGKALSMFWVSSLGTGRDPTAGTDGVDPVGLGTQGAGCNGAAVGLHNKGLQLGYLKDTPVAAKEFNAKKTWIQDVRERLCGCVMSVAFSKRLGFIGWNIRGK